MCTLYDCLKITQVFNKMGQKCLGVESVLCIGTTVETFEKHYFELQNSSTIQLLILYPVVSYYGI